MHRHAASPCPAACRCRKTTCRTSPRPETGLIVKFNNGVSQWRDQLGRNWNNAVKFTLPDLDVFKIDANGNPPAQIGVDADQYAHVGTVLFNMVANPANSKVYVSNTDAHNEVRFEGPGIVGGSTVRGHLHEARVTVLDGCAVLPRHLNKHINYCGGAEPGRHRGQEPGDAASAWRSAATAPRCTSPASARRRSASSTPPSSRTTRSTRTPATASPTCRWPAAARAASCSTRRNQRLYVLTRFDNSVSVVDTVTLAEEPSLKRSLYNPEPASVVGRPAVPLRRGASPRATARRRARAATSSATSTAWRGISAIRTTPCRTIPIPSASALVIDPDFHPMKGPMTTQSLRGMANHGPMHWRGDRTGGNDPGGDPLDEDAAFKKFNVAFAGLLGRSGPAHRPARCRPSPTSSCR